MIFKSSGASVILRVSMLLVTLTAVAWLLVTGRYAYLCFPAPLLIYQVIEICQHQRRTQRELELFIESVQYRDFSRHFDTRRTTLDVRHLREGFNVIIQTFKQISKEKETQYQYLQKILELVDTGILSFATDGEVVWMNESLKKMLKLPYLKTIQALERRDPGLFTALTELEPGTSRVFQTTMDRTSFRMLISATGFETDGRTYKLIAFQNVNEALEETESQAWQKLLSVLTHEIMNSVAPITSLAATLQERLNEAVPVMDIQAGAVDDLRLGIETIRRRSDGLLKFSETYRNLNKITTLHLQTIKASEVFENLLTLMQPMLDKKHIEVDMILKDPELSIQVDPSLIEQVLINLLVNAVDAVKDQGEPQIMLSALENAENQTVIRVSDNGPGIPSELLERIFIPFFSTKKSGSGIGLSLCKQIMMLHRGRIQVQSEPGKGTTFLLTLP